MQAILFFDDWLMDSHQGLVRRWGRPVPIGTPYSDPYSLAGAGYTHVEYNRDTKQWRAWVRLPSPEGAYEINPPDTGNGVVVMWVSEDGLTWRPWEGKGKGAQDGPWPHVVFSGSVASGSQVFCDPAEGDSQRRYKMASVIWAGRHPEGKGHMGQCYELHLFTSPDGITWRQEGRIHPLSSDTFHSFTYNPHSRQYQMTLRANTPDRRIWIVRSKDMRRWERPELVLSPDPADPPCVQFYGMPHYEYDGYYIGLLWLFHTQYGEPDPVKRQGTVDTHLVYSMNGLAWNRTVREPFIPLSEPGEPGCGSVYASALVEAPDGRLRIYAQLSGRQHGESGSGKASVGAYDLRKDGFVCLRPEGKYGELVTRAIVPTGNLLTINARAPRGQVRVEILDASENPLPEFSEENAACFTGDETAWQTVWPQASFAELRGRRIKLRLRLDNAELYAIRFEGYLAYSHTAIDNLDGTELGPTLLPADGGEIFI